MSGNINTIGGTFESINSSNGRTFNVTPPQTIGVDKYLEYYPYHQSYFPDLVNLPSLTQQNLLDTRSNINFKIFTAGDKVPQPDTLPDYLSQYIIPCISKLGVEQPDLFNALQHMGEITIHILGGGLISVTVDEGEDWRTLLEEKAYTERSHATPLQVNHDALEISLLNDEVYDPSVIAHELGHILLPFSPSLTLEEMKAIGFGSAIYTNPKAPQKKSDSLMANPALLDRIAGNPILIDITNTVVANHLEAPHTADDFLHIVNQFGINTPKNFEPEYWFAAAYASTLIEHGGYDAIKHVVSASIIAPSQLDRDYSERDLIRKSIEMGLDLTEDEAEALMDRAGRKLFCQ